MTDIGDFEREMLKQVRMRLGNEENLTDLKAKEIIIDVVFSDARAIYFELSDLDRMMNKIFLKTRKRLGVLEPLIENPNVSEIMVNGPKEIFVEENGKVKKCDLEFDTREELEEVIRNIAGDVNREINEMNPIVDARLKDGSRINGVYKNIAVNGPILTIRKFLDGFISADDLIKNETLTIEAADLLSALVESGYNIFISGGTSSGKTTLLNALATFIPKDERVIVIEDSMELKLKSIDNIVHMECRNGNAVGQGKITMTDLIKSSLRMRPDRIIVGEVRGAEVKEMLQAMNTGHQGSLSTGHANSVSGMLKRLETMYLSAVDTTIESIRQQIAEGIDIMVHVAKLKDGKRKIVEIAELVDYRNGEFILNSLMKNEGCLQSTGNKIRDPEKLLTLGSDKLDRLREYSFI